MRRLLGVLAFTASIVLIGLIAAVVMTVNPVLGLCALVVGVSSFVAVLVVLDR